MEDKCGEVLDCLLSAQFDIEQVSSANLIEAKKRLCDAEVDLRDALRMVSQLINECDKSIAERDKELMQ